MAIKKEDKKYVVINHYDDENVECSSMEKVTEYIDSTKEDMSNDDIENNVFVVDCSTGKIKSIKVTTIYKLI